VWWWNSFVENAVSREGFRGVLMPTQQKQKQATKKYLSTMVFNPFVPSCWEQRGEERV
jgi:hypothetical protein